MLNGKPIAAEKLSEFLCWAFAQACSRDRSEISAETPLIDLDIDSLTFVSVISQLEAACGVEIEPDELVELFGANTVADIVARFV